MKRKFLAALFALVMILSLTACGGSNAAMEDMKMESTTTEESTADSATGSFGGSVEYESGGSSSVAQTERKMIRTAELELETTGFDQAVTALSQLTEDLGGYYESSTIGNHGYGYRWANYTVRIPADKYMTFINQAGTLCHETWRNTTEQNVSEAYYDTQGRLKTQQIKLERLQALLAKAELMEDIITIESAISETEQQIDNLSGTLQHYDGLVDYATIHVNLQEVYKLSNVEEVPENFGSRMGNAFTSGWSDFVDDMEDLAVSLAYSWMHWLIFIGVVIVAAMVVRRVLRRRKEVRSPKAVPQDKEE